MLDLPAATAANRAHQTLQEFQQSPSAQEALYIMAESYSRLGLTELRDDTNRVLLKNFPSTTIQTDGIGIAKKPWWQIW